MRLLHLAIPIFAATVTATLMATVVPEMTRDGALMVASVGFTFRPG